MEDKNQPIIWGNFFLQRNSLEKLIEESKADSDFYFLLAVATLVTTLGIVIDNIVAIIGGMLIAPILYPILSLSMGITTSNLESVRRSLKNIGGSVILVLFISYITTFLFRGGKIEGDFIYKMVPDPIYFFIAFFAGLAAAFAWAKQNLSASLPGTAVSVSLLPPLATIGVSLVYNNPNALVSSASLFLINLVGIAIAAFLVFSLFGFSRFKKEEKELIQNEKIETAQQDITSMD